MIMLGIPLPGALAEVEKEYSDNTKKAEALPMEHPCAVPLAREHWVDRSHRYLSENVCSAALWFDSFFGDERAEAEQVDRYIKVIAGMEIKEGEGLSLRNRVRARIDLPRLKRHVNLILTNEDDDDVTRMVSDVAPSGTKREDKKDSETYSLALRWFTVHQPTSSFSTSAGINFGSPLKPYVKSRYRYTHGLGESALARFTQSVFWKNQEGFGETSRLDLERLLSEQNLLRWSLSATYSEVSDGLEWSTGMSLYRNISRRQAISYNTFITAASEPHHMLRDYGINLRYRRGIFRPWLFIELEPSISWPRDEDDSSRHTSLGFIIQFEVQFGRREEPFQGF